MVFTAQCDKCNLIIKNVNFKNEWTLPHSCGGSLEILWEPSNVRDAEVHVKERAIVWLDPKTNEVRYPGRNDVPMPERYRKAGFVRHELSSLRKLQNFEKERDVVSEIVHFDRGSGNGL